MEYTEHTTNSILSFKSILLVLIGVIFLLGAYQVGVFMGYRRAMYSFRWGQNYHRNFGGPPRGFFGDIKDSSLGFTDAHGIFGSVLKIEGSTLIILDKDQTEKKVLTTSLTSIRRANETIPISNIFATERVVIIGSPNEEGQIEARLIRLFPPQPPRLLEPQHL